MIGLVLTIVVGSVCLMVFLALALRHGREPSDDAARVPPVDRIAGLSGLPFSNLNLLLGSDDFEKLRSRADLRPVSVRLREDRRRIVLHWLRLLQEDVRVLWRFRRFLVRSGVTVTLYEEIRSFLTAALATAYVRGLRFFVFLFGPFVLREPLQRAKCLVERVSFLGAALLARMPASTSAEIERKWAKAVASTGNIRT